MPDFVVRPVRLDDGEGWLPLWRAYHLQMKNDPSDEVTRTTWGRFFDRAEPVHAVVAECNRALIGVAHYLFHRNTWTVAQDCYMQDIFVSPATRCMGVGRALIEAVGQKARDAGAPRLYWLGPKAGAEAASLYGKLAKPSGLIEYRKLLGT